jgi:DNA repair photolyase
MIVVKETQAKSVLNKSQIFDYCINPYTGCQVNCRYCYARLFMKRYSGHKEPWGEFVDVKINAPEVLRKQLLRAKRGRVWISSVCDPYQPLEAKYELTRRCLKELLNKQFPVNIQTKSKLVLRDLDLLKDFNEMEAGFTITTNDEKTARFFEPGAASISDRMKALERLHASGIRTFAFIGPLLPGHPEKLVADLDGLVDRVFIDRMNYLNQVKAFYRHLDLEWATEDAFFQQYKARLLSELRKRRMTFEAVF